MWLQTVYQVDESPRYASTGRWQHTPSFSTWLSGDTWRPLPRREWSVRSDYQVLVGSNRHTVVPSGWLQEENNLVRLRSSVATNAISLYKALGGGWEMSVGQPFVADPTRNQMQERPNWGDLFGTQPSIDLPPTGPSSQSPSSTP